MVPEWSTQLRTQVTNYLITAALYTAQQSRMFLPVEFRSFNECISLAIADETAATETREALGMIAVFTGELQSTQNNIDGLTPRWLTGTNWNTQTVNVQILTSIQELRSS